MAAALIVANLGLIPFSSQTYTFINKFIVPLAVPLLLFDSDLKRVINDTGSLLLAFLLGAISTIIGTIVAYSIIPLKTLAGDNGRKVASALAARHIGGAINFVAVSDTLNVTPTYVSAAIAADNLVTALYFAFLFYISKPETSERNKEDDNNNQTHSNDHADESDISNQQDSKITMTSIAFSLTATSCLLSMGKVLTNIFLPPGTSALPSVSLVTVAAATLYPNFFSKIRLTGTSMGILFMQMFFAASGAAGSIQLVLKSAPSLFLFSCIQICVHFITLMTLGKLVFRLRETELYLASNANVGGPTTAAAMAQAKNWTKLVLPALLVGILGYATATPIAIGLGQLLSKIS
mmetsp:Transcript_11004/g.15479  ORF Transcript_11004/g.15479 Transcript_11004/m.15479 type:complete len:350 (-) Transcript_11004:45-1094(-)